MNQQNLTVLIIQFNSKLDIQNSKVHSTVSMKKVYADSVMTKNKDI